MKTPSCFPAFLMILSLLPATSLCAGDASGALRESYAAEAKGDYAEALTCFYIELQQDPRNYFLQMRAGYLNQLLGKYEQSLSAYQAAERLESNGVEAPIGALKAAVMLGDWTKAETLANNVLRKDDCNYTALSRLAYAHFARKDYARSANFYQKVLDLYPSDLDMKNGLAWSVFYMGNKTKARTLFHEVLMVSPDNPTAAQGSAACQK